MRSRRFVGILLALILGCGSALATFGSPDLLIALTIDDGPDPRFTPRVLDTLSKYNSHATFFVIGKSVEEHPELAREIVRSGNEIANHTMTHPHLENLSYEETMQELNLAEEKIREVTGMKSVFFRPPRGKANPQAMQAIKNSGMRVAFWTLGLENHARKTPQDMVSRVMTYIEPGAVLLMHDGNLDRELSVRALPILLEALHEKGYRVVSLNELLHSGVNHAWRERYLCEPSCSFRH